MFVFVYRLSFKMSCSRVFAQLLESHRLEFIVICGGFCVCDSFTTRQDALPLPDNENNIRINGVGWGYWHPAIIPLPSQKAQFGVCHSAQKQTTN